MELLAKLNNLNARVVKSNSSRSVQLGRKETLEKQLAKAVEDYRVEFGVNLNDVGIDVEYSRVVSETEASATLLESALGAIESGNYTLAEELLLKTDGVIEDVEVVAEPESYGGVQEVIQEELTHSVAPVVQEELPVVEKIPWTPVVLEENLSLAEDEYGTDDEFEEPPKHVLTPSVRATVTAAKSIGGSLPQVVVSNIPLEKVEETVGKSRLMSRRPSGTTQADNTVPPVPAAPQQSGVFKFTPKAPINVGMEEDGIDSKGNSAVPSFKGLLGGTPFQGGNS